MYIVHVVCLLMQTMDIISQPLIIVRFVLCYVRAADEKDNDASSTSQESSDKVDPLESSECSSYSSLDDIEVEGATACDNLSSSMFSSCYTTTGGAKCSLVAKEKKTVFIPSQFCSTRDKFCKPY